MTGSGWTKATGNPSPLAPIPARAAARPAAAPRAPALALAAARHYIGRMPTSRPDLVQHRFHALAPNLRGALWVLAAALFFSTMALTAKALGSHLDSFQIAFFRAFFGLVVLLPFVLRAGLAELKTRRPGMHLARGTIGALAMFCGFYAITHLKLADAVAITYTRQLFLIILAVLFLGETVRLRRWSATAVGFVGVLVMLRPGAELEMASLVALLGAFLIAVVNVFVKKLAATDRPLTLLLYFGVISTAVTLVPALMVWRAPSAAELVLLVLVGALGAAAHACMVRGFALGEATAVMPFDYMRLLFAGVVGFLVFAELPDRWTVAGAAIIVASTLYIALRELRLGKAELPPVVQRTGLNPPLVPARDEGKAGS